MATEKWDPQKDPQSGSNDDVMQRAWRTLDSVIDKVEQCDRGDPRDKIADKAWQLLDDVISDVDRKELIETLEKDEEARRVYVECVQLHVGLLEHFNQGEDPWFFPKSRSVSSTDIERSTENGRSVK